MIRQSHRKSFLLALLVFLSIGVALSSCSTTTAEKKVTTTVTESPRMDSEGKPSTITTTTKTSETETKDDGCGGILSCTVDAVGAIIALPFRLVAGIVDVIF